jgi:hypothetical protein
MALPGRQKGKTMAFMQQCVAGRASAPDSTPRPEKTLKSSS